MLRIFALVIVTGITALALPCRAQDALRLDLVRGPLITSSRIMGLGGAFTGVGEGIDGIYRNPAALANRNERSTSFFDIDVTVDWMFVSSSKIDWDADGHPLSQDIEFRALNLGLVMQLGALGLGVLATDYGWAGEGFQVQHTDVLVGAGWAFADGAVVAGAGATYSRLAVSALVGTAPVATAALIGTCGDFGVLWRPPNHDWRLGLRFRSQSKLQDEAATFTGITGIIPWQLALGWSSYYTPVPGRSYNPALRRRVPKPLDRRFLGLSAEVVLLGRSNGDSLESIIAETPRPAGRKLSLGLHLGAEGEVIHDLMKARVGAYLEPVRVAGGRPFRAHLTGGLEVHLFEFLFDWKANVAFDVAPGWENLTIGLGFWK